MRSTDRRRNIKNVGPFEAGTPTYPDGLPNISEANRLSASDPGIHQLVASADLNPAIRDSCALILAPRIFPPLGEPRVPWVDELILQSIDAKVLGVEIVMPADGQDRARNLISRSRRVATGMYPSWKMQRLMHWESREEAKVFRLLDASPAILRFSEQPFTIRYWDAGEWRHHIPDVAVETTSGDRLILEIKSTRDPKLGDALRRAEIIAPAVRMLGCQYAVVHQRDINAGTSLQNARLLLRFGRAVTTAQAHQQFLRLLDQEGPLTRQRLLGTVIEGAHAIHAGAQLALQGLISIDWGRADKLPLSFCHQSQDNTRESLRWLLRALGVTSRL